MTPDFHSWSQDTLARFAQEVYTKLKQTQDENEQLKLDFRDAMDALRREMINRDA